MTREEAIKWLDGIEKKYIHGGDESFDNSRKQAIHMAIRSCSERLPEEDGRYLCTYSDFGVCVDFGLYTDGQWIIEPVAWMPLPVAYKGEKNG